MTRPSRAIGPLLCALALPATLAWAVERGVYRDIRGRFEGRALRLRVDLKAATTAGPPNLVGVHGIGYGRERARVIFGRLETVYLRRVTNEGRRRLNLTVYRSKEESDRLRASAVPSTAGSNPNFGRTLAHFAQLGSTTVVLEVKAGRDEPGRQLGEIERLLESLFYLDSEPSRAELEEYVRRHPGLSVTRLRDITGLPPHDIRALLEQARGNPPAPDR